MSPVFKLTNIEMIFAHFAAISMKLTQIVEQSFENDVSVVESRQNRVTVGAESILRLENFEFWAQFNDPRFH